MGISQIIDGSTNARFYAWTRLAVGLLALTKGAHLLYLGNEPAAVLPWMLAATLFAAGIVPLLTGAVVCGLGFSLLQEQYNNHFYTLLLVVFFATLSESRATFALFATRQMTAPAWPATLMKVQVSVIYCYAGIAKLNGEWLSGDVLAFHFRNSLLHLPGGAWFTVPQALAVPAVEIAIGVLVWSSRFRNVAFALLLPLHVGMVLISNSLLTVYGIGVFAPITFLLVQAFAVPETPRLVVWDDGCVFCRRWVRAFRALDAFHGLRFVGSSSPQAYDGTGVTPAAADLAMQFVAPDGSVHTGFAAVRQIVHTLPFGFLFSPWFAVPGIKQVGDRAYAAVAARRRCVIGEAPESVSVR